jgi:hypothetical protein
MESDFSNPVDYASPVDFPKPIDDSLPFNKHMEREREPEPEHVRYYEPPPQVQYYEPPPQVQYFEPKKSGDILSELKSFHWIIIIAIVLVAFFIGKSMSTPVILKMS